MIQANELRVFNWVLINGEHNVIRGGGIAAIESSNFNVEPIPLTPEILVKAGFDEIQDGWFQFDPKALFLSWNIYDNEFRAMGYRFSHIKHLHQLQNLYFALTGEELTFEL